jgi:carbonic anhydrase
VKRICCSVLALLMSLFLPAVAQEHAADTPHAPAGSVAEAQSAERIWAELLAGNKRFVAGKTKVREYGPLRSKLAGGQHPRVIVLACSDSRVPPELLFDKTLGDLFAVRAAGNVADAIGLGSIEYAVEHLGSSLLVILGHQKCGAVTAACSHEKMPTENLQAIVDKIEPAVEQATHYAKPDALVAAAIEENIHQSAKDVLGNSAVLRQALKEGKLSVIEAMYNLETGQVIRLGKLSVLAPAYKLDVGDIVRVE